MLFRSCSLRERLGAGLAGLALTYTVGRAVLIGLASKKRPFMRTPKLTGRPNLWRAILMVREEAALMVLLWASAAATYVTFGDYDPESHWWSLALLTQSIPYLAALTVSSVATLSPPPPAGRAEPADDKRKLAA